MLCLLLERRVVELIREMLGCGDFQSRMFVGRRYFQKALQRGLRDLILGACENNTEVIAIALEDIADALIPAHIGGGALVCVFAVCAAWAASM